MPFSETSSCTEAEWTEIFEKIFKQSIESSGLDYECRRSEATRGNIIGGIIRDLNDSHVVVADLTDRNANVFYELGVRHSLKNRTIILAQKRDDIPFDLQAYASHVYSWKTDDDKIAFAIKIKDLLDEVVTNPDRPDNPVADFLGSPSPNLDPLPVEVPREDIAQAQSLLGVGTEGLDPGKFAATLASESNQRSARIVYRLTNAELPLLVDNALTEINKQDIPSQMQENDIEGFARPLIAKMEPIIRPVEQFSLASFEHGWDPGVGVAFRIAGNLISLGSQMNNGTRFAIGTPGLLAWRILLLLGAKAVADEEYGILRKVILDPIDVEEKNGLISNRSFPQRRELFSPEAFLRHADLDIRYIQSLFGSETHLASFFESEERFHYYVGQFLMLVALAHAKLSEERQLFPGYRAMPKAPRAMMALCSRMSANVDYMDSIDTAIGFSTGLELQHKWSELVTKANSVGGAEFFSGEGPRFPDPLASEAQY